MDVENILNCLKKCERGFYLLYLMNFLKEKVLRLILRFWFCELYEGNVGRSLESCGCEYIIIFFFIFVSDVENVEEVGEMVLLVIEEELVDDIICFEFFENEFE